MNITEMYKIFSTEESCIAYLEKIRWGKEYLLYALIVEVNIRRVKSKKII